MIVARTRARRRRAVCSRSRRSQPSIQRERDHRSLPFGVIPFSVRTVFIQRRKGGAVATAVDPMAGVRRLHSDEERRDDEGAEQHARDREERRESARAVLQIVHHVDPALERDCLQEGDRAPEEVAARSAAQHDVGSAGSHHPFAAIVGSSAARARTRSG
eukprot:3187096-Prymnesium_polylepis.1